jgi:hypothetical protein
VFPEDIEIQTQSTAEEGLQRKGKGDGHHPTSLHMTVISMNENPDTLTLIPDENIDVHQLSRAALGGEGQVANADMLVIRKIFDVPHG